MPLQAILKIVVPILLGAVIGYFTNALAIKMLFRPRRAVYIGKRQLPFTPGIIPKNQPRIAKAVGNAVSGQLFTSDDLADQLKKALAGADVAGKLTDAIFGNGMTLRGLSELAAAPEASAGESPVEVDAGTETEADRKTVPELAPDMVSPAVTDAIAAPKEPDPEDDGELEELDLTDEPTGAADRIGKYVADLAAEKLAGADLRDTIDDMVWEAVQDYRKNPVIALFLNESALDALCVRVESALRNYVNGDGKRVLRRLVAEEARAAADRPIGELADSFGLERGKIAEALGRTLDRFVEQFGASFAGKTDIGGIVQRKIEEMDTVQLEELVMSVMKNELQAVIDLGALIGAVIGAVNILF